MKSKINKKFLTAIYFFLAAFTSTSIANAVPVNATVTVYYSDASLTYTTGGATLHCNGTSTSYGEESPYATEENAPCNHVTYSACVYDAICPTQYGTMSTGDLMRLLVLEWLFLAL